MSDGVAKEARGGARVSRKGLEITESVKTHILSFRCRESHYARDKSVRSYLPPEYSIKRMWSIWKDRRKADNLTVCSYSKYRLIFETKFI